MGWGCFVAVRKHGLVFHGAGNFMVQVVDFMDGLERNGLADEFRLGRWISQIEKVGV
jgi:hypothetical protein